MIVECHNSLWQYSGIAKLLNFVSVFIYTLLEFYLWLPQKKNQHNSSSKFVRLLFYI
jgi:hypothetical protein